MNTLNAGYGLSCLIERGSSDVNVNFILFTDGSVRRFKDNDKRKTVSAYGVVVLDVLTKRYTTFSGSLGTDSIVYAEAWAIYRGLQFINKSCKKRMVKPTVLVVTDNKLNVSILSDYIPNLWDLSNWNCWRKRDGSKVKNQEVYQNIMELIIDNDLQVRFTHINSHLSSGDWKMIQNKLKDSGINLDKELCKIFVKMNNLADNLATGITLEQKETIRSAI